MDKDNVAKPDDIGERGAGHPSFWRTVINEGRGHLVVGVIIAVVGPIASALWIIHPYEVLVDHIHRKAVVVTEFSPKGKNSEFIEVRVVAPVVDFSGAKIGDGADRGVLPQGFRLKQDETLRIYTSRPITPAGAMPVGLGLDGIWKDKIRKHDNVTLRVLPDLNRQIEGLAADGTVVAFEYRNTVLGCFSRKSKFPETQ